MAMSRELRSSAATSLYTAGQQLAATIGVSVGALALEVARTLSRHQTPETSDFSAAFVVVGLMTLAAVPIASDACYRRGEFIDEGYFASHIRRMRRLYEERHEALCEAATRELGGLLDVVRTDSGLHTIGHLPAHLSEIAVARAAASRGIAVSPIARFSIEPTEDNGLVLGFAGIKPAEIKSGVGVLSEVLEGMTKPRPTASPSSSFRRKPESSGPMPRLRRHGSRLSPG